MRYRSAALLLPAALVPLLVALPGTASSDARPVAQVRATQHACPTDAVQEDGFPDVAWTNAHEAAVDCVVHWGVASGRTASSYAPATSVDRGQMATFLVRLVERSGGTLPAPSGDRFSDDEGNPHEPSIERLAAAGVVDGTGASTYSPLAPVSRAQMAALLTRVYDLRAEQAGLPALAEGGDHFSDDDASPLAAEIDKAAAAGFAGGYGDGTYRPGAAVPRDTMATFLARVLDLVVEGGASAVPAGPRSLTRTGYAAYATAGPVVLRAPGDVVEVIGFHEAGHKGAQRQEPAGGPRTLVLPTRSRGTDPQSAADVVVDPSREVRAPVSGVVKRAGAYQLYCRYTDEYLVVEPDARPGWEVKLLHVEGLRVAAGTRVEGGETVVADRARLFPFRSQVDDHTAAPHWPHVHVEVVDPSVPNPGGGGC